MNPSRQEKKVITCLGKRGELKLFGQTDQKNKNHSQPNLYAICTLVVVGSTG